MTTTINYSQLWRYVSRAVCEVNYDGVTVVLVKLFSLPYLNNFKLNTEWCCSCKIIETKATCSFLCCFFSLALLDHVRRNTGNSLHPEWSNVFCEQHACHQWNTEYYILRFWSCNLTTVYVWSQVLTQTVFSYNIIIAILQCLKWAVHYIVFTSGKT